MSTSVIGISLALIAGVIQSIGFVLQKKGHNQLIKNHNNQYPADKIEIPTSSPTDFIPDGSPIPDPQQVDNALKDEDKLSVTSIPIWWCGIILYQIGSAMRAISLSFAAQSIIAPLLAFNIAINSILAHFFLKEKITSKDVIAIIFIIIGVILIVVFGPSSEDDVDLTVSDLRILFQQIDYIIFVSIVSSIVVIVYIITKYIEHRNFISSNSHSITYGSKFLLISWTFIAGYFRANNTLFVKSLITIIKSSFESTENLYDYLTYTIGLLWIVCLLSGEYFRQRAFSYFGATLVVPLDIVVYVVLSVFLGSIFFDELNEMNSALNTSLFLLGLMIILGAVITLSYDIGKHLDELHSEIIKVIYIDPQKVDYKEPNIAVVGGVVAQYYYNVFFREIPFFMNRTIEDPDLDEQGHKQNPSFSWNSMRPSERQLSEENLVTKLTWTMPFSFLFALSLFLFAKYEVSFYRFGALWIVASQAGLLLFLYRAFGSTQLYEVRSKAHQLDGFSPSISFCTKLELRKSKPITSVCRFAGVRGSTQELLFSIYILGAVSLISAMTAMKAAERGNALFVNNNAWDQGRRIDISLLIFCVTAVALFGLYLIAVVEHGSIGRNIHLFCGVSGVMTQPIGFLIQQNFSVFSIICMVISMGTLIVYKVNGKRCPNTSDDAQVVHKWSLINLSVETGMILWASLIGAVIVFAMDGDAILFQ